MQKVVTAVRISLLISILICASAIVLGLALGSDKPFAPTFALMSGLISFGILSASTWSTPDCPSCGTKQPARRRPTSFRQAIRGGWTCANCSTEIDRHGRAINRQV
jgi:hypothetical protein